LPYSTIGDGVKEMTIKPHVSKNSQQRVNRAIGQSAVRVRQVPSGFFTRKKEHLRALDGKRITAPVDARPSTVAFESAMFALSVVCIGGAVNNDVQFSREARELNAVVEKTLVTEIRIASNNAASGENLTVLIMTLGLAGFFGMRLLRVAQAKLGKNAEAAPENA